MHEKVSNSNRRKKICTRKLSVIIYLSNTTIVHMQMRHLRLRGRYAFACGHGGIWYISHDTQLVSADFCPLEVIFQLPGQHSELDMSTPTVVFYLCTMHIIDD